MSCRDPVSVRSWSLQCPLSLRPLPEKPSGSRAVLGSIPLNSKADERPGLLGDSGHFRGCCEHAAQIRGVAKRVQSPFSVISWWSDVRFQCCALAQVAMDVLHTTLHVKPQWRRANRRGCNHNKSTGCGSIPSTMRLASGSARKRQRTLLACNRNPQPTLCRV